MSWRFMRCHRQSPGTSWSSAGAVRTGDDTNLIEVEAVATGAGAAGVYFNSARPTARTEPRVPNSIANIGLFDSSARSQITVNGVWINGRNTNEDRNARARPIRSPFEIAVLWNRKTKHLGLFESDNKQKAPNIAIRVQLVRPARPWESEVSHRPAAIDLELRAAPPVPHLSPERRGW